MEVTAEVNNPTYNHVQTSRGGLNDEIVKSINFQKKKINTKRNMKHKLKNYFRKRRRLKTVS